MPQRQNLSEARPALIAEATGTSGVYRIQLINPGWGSSGHYSPTVLAEAARDRVFAEGLHMYADHPRGDGSGVDSHGNRSVTDLWAVLASDATIADDGALVAEARVFGPYRELVDSMRADIGLSIRALGSYELGEADGRRGQIITSIDEAMSVDFVTAAGRGGRILQLVESVRHDPGAQAALTRLAEATANDIRDALSTAVDEDYQVPEEQWAWVRDYDPDAGLVYFDISGRGEDNGTYSQPYVLNDDGSCELTGTRTEVAVRTVYVPVAPEPAQVGESQAARTHNDPVNPAGQSHPEESEEDTMPQIEEARLRQLEEAAGRVQALESERDAANQRATTAEAALAESTARNTARPIVAEVLGQSQTLPPASVARVTESVVAQAPLTTAGLLDEAALRTAAETARTAAETEIAEALAAHGAGKVRGFGGSQEIDVVESEYDQRSAGVFGRTELKGA